MTQKTFARFRQPTPDEQEILTHLVVQLVRPEEVERFDQLIAKHHYLKSGQVVGEHLRYVAQYRGQWLALATWSAAALHIKARDRFIGWTEEQRRRRLPLLVNSKRQAGCIGSRRATQPVSRGIGFHRLGTNSLICEAFIEGNRRKTSVRYSWGLMPRRRQLMIIE